ncbi:MAG: flavin reductase family protein [Trueperaceae bacterium]|nr:flavin reductase family protein [Trueperaceae bacterium]
MAATDTTSASFSSRDFRNTLGRFATGVTVVTMQQGDEVFGITVSAFMSVSLEPPLVLVSIDKKARAHPTLLEAERYGVSILSASQQALSNHFAGMEVDGLEPPYQHIDGFPLLEGAVGHLVCRVVDRHEAGDHTLFIGQVEHLAYEDKKPLLYYTGKYGRLEPPQNDPLLDG